MATDLLLRPATPDDTPAILDLVKLSLGEGSIPRDPAYWAWKHASSPFGPSPTLLAESNGSIVGLRVFMRWNWRARGSMFTAVRAVDTATHPDWRGKGIFSRLTMALLERMKSEGTSFVFNTPNDQSRPGYLKMGWMSVGRISLWVRPISPFRLARALLAPGATNGVHREGVALAGAPAGALLAQPGFERFLASLADRNDRLATPWTPDYCQWRYSAIPGFEYRALWSFDGDDGAFIIFRSKDRRNIRELRLCEVMVGASSKSRRMGRDLLDEAVRGSSAHYASGMVATGSSAQSVLLRSAFLPAPRIGPIMTVRPLNGVGHGLDPLRRSDWHLSIGDLELF